MSANHGHYEPGFSNFFKNPSASLKHAFSEMSDPGHVIGHMLLLHPIVNAVTIGAQTAYDTISGIPYRGPKSITEFVGKLLHFKFTVPNMQKTEPVKKTTSIQTKNSSKSPKILIEPEKMPSYNPKIQQYSDRSPIVTMPQ